MILARTALAVLAVLPSAAAPGLAQRIRAAMESSPAAARAKWGIQARSLRTGALLFQSNVDGYFIPASNTKLYSTALALQRLGPDHRFATTVVRDPNGDVRIIGTGDPSMSGRAYPYVKGPHTGNPLGAIEGFADLIAAAGIRHIRGDIVGDATRWPWQPYPEGWALDDAVWEYGAPVGALTVNDNAVKLTIAPGAAPGEPARLILDPPLEYYAIDNRVVTQPGPRRIKISADGGAQLSIRGTIAPGGAEYSQLLAIDEPPLYAALALHDALTRRGVRIDGRAVARKRPVDEPIAGHDSACEELARRTSPPLIDILQVINKVSQNLHAELILREVGFQATGEGTVEAGLAELEMLLAEIGIAENEYDFRDGSGLSRLTLTTPANTVKLLTRMHEGPHRNAWLAAMPIGGVDGTLEKRFEGKKQGALVKAKTGTISHVNSLSGYIDSKSHGTVVFSIMANASNGPSADIRSAIDKICMELAK